VNLSRLDEAAIDFDLLEDLVLSIDTKEGAGSILVFLPGMGEIMNLTSRLEGNPQCVVFVGFSFLAAPACHQCPLLFAVFPE
jgi:HrpA-like RNA helicase